MIIANILSNVKGLFDKFEEKYYTCKVIKLIYIVEVIYFT